MKDFDIKYRDKLIDTFQRLTLFMKENNLSYYAAYGTLLGAVRHKGLIPWDDDVDIHMFREDYEKLFSLKESLAKYNLRLCSMEEDGYYMPFAKICDSNSTILEFPNQSYTLGLYIDIFILDKTSLSEEQFREFDNRYKRKWRLYNASMSSYTIAELFSILGKGEIFYFARQVGCKFLNLFRSYCKNSILQLNEIIKNCEGDKPTLFFAAYDKHFFKNEWFDETIELDFEGFKIRAPKDYDGYLRFLYNNYMELPPVENRVYKHDHFYTNLNHRISFEDAKIRVKKGIREEE